MRVGFSLGSSAWLWKVPALRRPRRTPLQLLTKAKCTRNFGRLRNDLGGFQTFRNGLGEVQKHSGRSCVWERLSDTAWKSLSKTVWEMLENVQKRVWGLFGSCGALVFVGKDNEIHRLSQNQSRAPQSQADTHSSLHGSSTAPASHKSQTHPTAGSCGGVAGESCVGSV